MVKANSYIELKTDDLNVIIKGNLARLSHSWHKVLDFSPIKINKWGDRMFSMTLETKQINSLDGKIKTKRENIKVKVSDTCFIQPSSYINEGGFTVSSTQS